MSKVEACLQLLAVYLSLKSVECQGWINEIRAFIEDNGLRYVTLLENSTSPSPYVRSIMLAASQRANFYLRASRIQGYTENYQKFDLDVQILLYYPEYDDLGYFLKVIQNTKVGRSILLLTNPWQGANDMLNDHLLGTPNLFFYIASLPFHEKEANVLSWQKSLTLKSGYTIHELKFKEGSLSITEDFDLNGLKITSTSLSWEPYLTIEGCDEQGTNCAKHFGYLVDYMDALSKNLNFSFASYKDLVTKI